MFKSSIKKNNQNFVFDHETDQILTCESPFGIAFQTFTGTKALKGALSGLRQFLAAESSLKMMKNAFYLTSKALLILKIFKFLS